MTRLIYTVHPNIRGVIGPLSSSIPLSNIYTHVPYKQYNIYVENRPINTTILSKIHQAIRESWAKTNNGLFSTKDLLIPSIRSIPSAYVSLDPQRRRLISLIFRDAQLRLEYLIGLRGADIGDYAPPTESLYSEIFNQAKLGTFVSTHYKPRDSQEVSLNDDSLSLFPFDYRSGGPFYGVKSLL